ncbi:MAG: SDR family NAD(P)-dependent oxidoreductase, partial [Anaerolineales bacterium]
MRSPQDLRGKTALVTGAARRLGRAIALGLAEQGVNVAVHYHRSAAEAEDVARRGVELGVRSIAMPADLADPRQAAALLERAEAKLGPIEILVNNAAAFDAG